MRAQLLVMLKISLRAPTTWASLFEFKSTHTEASFFVVNGLVGLFEASVRIAADFRQQWPQSDRPRFEPFLEIVAVLFVDRVLACLPSKSVTPSMRERSVCVCMCVCVCVWERETLMTRPLRNCAVDLLLCVCERERDGKRERERKRKRERERERERSTCVYV